MKKPQRHASLNREYRFLYVQDVMELLCIGQTKAYGIIRKLNKDLEDAGYEKPVAGRVSETYFRERFYLGEPTPVQVRQKPNREPRTAASA